MKAIRTSFKCRLFSNDGYQVCAPVIVNVPSGLTREQAFDYCAGRLVSELRRYCVQEALGLSESNSQTDWQETVT